MIYIYLGKIIFYDVECWIFKVVKCVSLVCCIMIGLCLLYKVWLLCKFLIWKLGDISWFNFYVLFKVRIYYIFLCMFVFMLDRFNLCKVKWIFYDFIDDIKLL